MSEVTAGRPRPAVRDRGHHLARRLGYGVLVASLALFGLFGVAPPASAHGGNESNEAYVLVLQALGHLAHDTGHEGMDLAMEKIDDALAAEDQDGVAVTEVKQAKQALEAEQIGLARTLLQSSIKVALSQLGPARGEQTGTTVVVPALAGREGLSGRDWGFLGASLIFLLIGLGLAYRFRPVDTVGELRQRAGLSETAVSGDTGDTGEGTNVDRGPG